MEFFLTAAVQTAEQAAATSRDLIAMLDVHPQQIAGLGRAASSALCVLELMQASPILTVQTVAGKLTVSFPTATAALGNLAKIGVLGKTTGRQNGRIDAYAGALALLDRRTDPLPTGRVAEDRNRAHLLRFEASNPFARCRFLKSNEMLRAIAAKLTLEQFLGTRYQVV